MTRVTEATLRAHALANREWRARWGEPEDDRDPRRHEQRRAASGGDEKVADITRGIRALIDLSRREAPNATIIVTGILPRNDNIAVMPEITRINETIARMADRRWVRYLDINDKLADADGKLFEGWRWTGCISA